MNSYVDIKTTSCYNVEATKSFVCKPSTIIKKWGLLMEYPIDVLRAKKVRAVFTFSKKKCSSCNSIFGLEKMWAVNRFGVNNTCNTWYYCTHCMPTAKDVLYEIDTDECYFGIYPIDRDRNFKKDTRRMDAARERAFGNLGK